MIINLANHKKVRNFALIITIILPTPFLAYTLNL